MPKGRSVSLSAHPARSVSAACWQCESIGPHRIAAELELIEEMDGVDLHHQRWDSLVSCMVCSDTFFVREIHWIDVRESPTSPTGSHVEVYPTLELGKTPMSGFNLLPDEIRNIYQGTRSALCTRNITICGLGIRAILEEACSALRIHGGQITERLEELVARGITTQHVVDTLRGLTAIGHENPFEPDYASYQQVFIAWRMVEEILSAAFLKNDYH